MLLHVVTKYLFTVSDMIYILSNFIMMPYSILRFTIIAFVFIVMFDCNFIVLLFHLLLHFYNFH